MYKAYFPSQAQPVRSDAGSALLCADAPAQRGTRRALLWCAQAQRIRRGHWRSRHRKDIAASVPFAALGKQQGYCLRLSVQQQALSDRLSAICSLRFRAAGFREEQMRTPAGSEQVPRRAWFEAVDQRGDCRRSA